MTLTYVFLSNPGELLEGEVELYSIWSMMRDIGALGPPPGDIDTINKIWNYIWHGGNPTTVLFLLTGVLFLEKVQLKGGA